MKVLQAYDARRGTVVQVREGHWKGEFGGMHGTIQWRSGQSEHAVVEVLLEDGRLELFWPSNLEAIERDIAV
jgi:hypothetical protein